MCLSLYVNIYSIFVDGYKDVDELVTMKCEEFRLPFLNVKIISYEVDWITFT